MESIKMEDVPKNVWDRVHKKWSDVLETGWDPDLWNPCALCEYMKFVYGGSVCHLCPLNKYDWCRSRSANSRLHVLYAHHCDETRWMEDVKSFLEYIKPYCSDSDDIEKNI